MTERKIALSIEEAADYTGIGRNTLRKLVEWKKLPVLKVGRKVLIKTDILEKFMEANEGRDLRDKGNVLITKLIVTRTFKLNCIHNQVTSNYLYSHIQTKCETEP